MMKQQPLTEYVDQHGRGTVTALADLLDCSPSAIHQALNSDRDITVHLSGGQIVEIDELVRRPFPCRGGK